MEIAKNLMELEYLRKLLDYNENTGLFTWKITKIENQVKVGMTAGYISRGYRFITIDNITYRAHNLAWFYFYGNWPEFEIDHIDLDKDNNSISNLRLATRNQQVMNRTKQKNNTTGFKGVSKHRNKFQASIGYNNKKIYIGKYKTPEEAFEAYKTKALELFGEFANF